MPVFCVIIIAIALLVITAYRFAMEVIRAKPKDRPKYYKIYAILAIVSVVLFAGIKISGLSQIMFPQYYQFQQTSIEESRGVLEDFINETKETVTP